MEQLSWLPAHPGLGAAIGEARREPDLPTRLRRVAELSGWQRDFVQTGRLDRIAQACLNDDPMAPAAAGLAPTRIALLSSHTVEHLVPAIRVAGLARQLAVSVHVAAYGQYRQVLFGDDAPLAAFAPQLIVLALDAWDAPIQVPLDASQAQVEDAVAVRVAELRTLWRHARERFSARVVQQMLVPTTPPLFGAFEPLVPSAPTTVIDLLNRAIRSAAREEGVLLLDPAWLTAHAGAGVAEPARWHQAKQLVSPVLAPLYGDLVARIAAAGAGRSRKCLVLDLDNTLWGGVVGDDGVDGLRLGQGHASGEAHLAFQRYVALLARRGIVLAVCSKNDEAVAEAGFAHPEMALARGDIAMFVANWEDKATNLRRIAQALNLGLDSLVFVDDNPAERDIVRRELPQVAVPELPDDVADYASCLAAAGYFEAVTFTADDAMRSRSYALDGARQEARSEATDMASYLRGLEMTLHASPIGPSELARAAQLINKTNQFNLTTRRYTDAQLESLLQEASTVSLAFRLRDKFGDNGLISVVLARPEPTLPPDALLIDTWLMSCRVLGRQVEQAVLDVLLAAAAQQGARRLIGEYRTTPRNGMVADHYPRLGFQPIPAPDGAPCAAGFWQYDIDAHAPSSHFIHIDIS